jgi:hypothetical protein
MLMQQEASIQQPCRNNQTNVSYAAFARSGSDDLDTASLHSAVKHTSQQAAAANPGAGECSCHSIVHAVCTQSITPIADDTLHIKHN